MQSSILEFSKHTLLQSVRLRVTERATHANVFANRKSITNFHFSFLFLYMTGLKTNKLLVNEISQKSDLSNQINQTKPDKSLQ